MSDLIVIAGLGLFFAACLVLIQFFASLDS